MCGARPRPGGGSSQNEPAALAPPEREAAVPHVQANNIEVYYEVQGDGEPLVLIPYLAADQACYAFQVADYAKRFEGCAHAPIYENVAEFNARTMDFLTRNS